MRNQTKNYRVTTFLENPRNDRKFVTCPGVVRGKLVSLKTVGCLLYVWRDSSVSAYYFAATFLAHCIPLVQCYYCCMTWVIPAWLKVPQSVGGKPGNFPVLHSGRPEINKLKNVAFLGCNSSAVYFGIGRHTV